MRTSRSGGSRAARRLAASIGVSASQAHTSLRRLEASGLYRGADRSLRVHAFTGFATHGIPYLWAVQPGKGTVGLPTAHGAAPLSELLVFDEAYVWPGHGDTAGRAVIPLHPAVPAAALADPGLYRALALLDALRVGRVRERRFAAEELERLLAERDEAWTQTREAIGAR